MAGSLQAIPEHYPSCSQNSRGRFELVVILMSSNPNPEGNEAIRTISLVDWTSFLGRVAASDATVQCISLIPPISLCDAPAQIEGPQPRNSTRTGLRWMSGLSVFGVRVIPVTLMAATRVGSDVGICWEHGTRTGFPHARS
jgi:hypothetical protein